MVGRTQRVVIDGEESEECTVDSGVPQGSVLGPLLFIIFINDIAANIDPATCIRLFADDALLYRRIDTVEDHLKLQADLSSLQTWADQWGMTFNTDKCYSMHIMTKKKRKDTVSIPYNMNGTELERVSNTKYLGATISDDLSWKTHNERAAGKAHGMISFLQRNLWMLPERLREQAYTTIVRPGLEYASSITDPYRPGEIQRLEKVQRHAARFVTNNPRTRFNPDEEQVSVTDLVKDLKWQSLEERRKQSRCTLMFRVKQNLVAVPDEYKPAAHGRVLRSTSRGNLPRARRVRNNIGTAWDMSFLPRTCRDWEQLPPAAKTASKLGAFKAALQPRV